MEEETLCKIDDDGDPGIQINFADATSTENCLALVSLARPASGVPVLTRGKNKVLNLLVGDLCFTHVHRYKWIA